MELRKFKEKNPKKLGIILFTISCILLISGVILYRTFAIFQVDTTQNVINGSIEDPGDIYFAFYKDGNIQKEMPKKSEGYVLDEQESSCGVNGTNTDSIKVSMTEDEVIHVSGVATSRTKCNLYFVKGVYILGKGVPIATSGDGLYVVKHPASETEGMKEEWQTDEYRFAGVNPSNYVLFNDELWRIIGLVNVKVTKEDGNEGIEQRLKIVRGTSIGNKVWDSSNVNDWTKATLMTELNNGEYFTTQLKDNAKGMIDTNIIWNIGGSNTFEDVTVRMFYNRERGTTVYTGRPTTWPKDGNTNDETYHSIALPYPSDYAYATNGGTLGREECFKKELYSWDDGNYATQCAQMDWLRPVRYMWLLSPSASNYFNVFFVYSDGYVRNDDSGVHTLGGVWPTLYLKTNVKITSGDGSNTMPFKIVQMIE